LDFNIFSLVLFVSGLAVLTIAAAIFKRLDESIRWFAITMLIVAVWAIAYGFELGSTQLSSMLFWIKIEYLGIAFAPATWLWFCIVYSNKDSMQRKKIFILVFLIPSITYLAVLTNKYHFLHYATTTVDLNGPFPLLAITPGPWYYVHTIYFYTSLLIGNYLLYQTFKGADSIFRTQIYLLMGAGLFPWLVNVIYLFGFRPFEHIDLTPYAFLAIYLIVGTGLLRFDLFNIKPIARDKTLSVIEKGIMVFDPLNRLIDINDSCRKLLNLPKSGLIGRDCQLVIGEFPVLIEKIRERAKDSMEFYAPKLNKHLFLQFSPILDHQQRHSGVLVFIDDVTERLETQQKIKNQADELERLNHLKDKLFSIISHDLKGPIIGINELLKMTNSGIVSKEEFFKILPNISKNIDAVSILLENLLAWTSVQMKGERVEKNPFDISILVEQTYNLYKARAQEKGVNFKIEDNPEIIIHADRNMIDLVLRNLVSNAIKFCGTGDQVRILLSHMAGWLTIEVLDTGLGITPENLQKLESGDSFTTPGKNKESGTGLGLLLVKDYIHKNGGLLTIQSEPNKGSTFCVLLPTT
jgi:signal transduction histidine kinase